MAAGELSEKTSLRKAELANEALKLFVADPTPLKETLDGVNPFGSFVSR